ncbi:RNB domain-containing ribonuclease, partial [Candidatus Gracilibacteria bacterium]|nr:RNB domain-containing ribonuclease [Candidatus Gracilibacteria bacterium]
MSRSHLFITGNLRYTPRKITLTSGDVSYFVKPYQVQSGYVHGDRVRARITKQGDGGRMAEVEIISLVSRSRDPLIARIISKKGKQYLKIIPEQGNLEILFLSGNKKYDDNSIISVQFSTNDRVEIVGVFAHEDDVDLDERLILWLSGARTEFPESVIRESDEVKQYTKKTNLKNRVDFRNWYTLTIDGSDAKDLDDAISIKKEENGNYILAVHIADVAEYVTENSQLDREALLRATSIYTPGKVIPMLPEVLSNDLCSLHPGTPKLSLSAVMTIDPRGNVRHTEIVEGIIESRHRGVYDDIYRRHSEAIGEKTELDDILDIAFALYYILEKRRRKEGKITFESTEIYFDFGTTHENDDKNGEKQAKTPKHIKKRERNDAHKLIEEFMVLANEEVAKWCQRHGLPFLSRVHGLPGNEQTEIIQAILRSSKSPIFEDSTRGELILTKPKGTPVLEPTHIREFLENIKDPTELYRYSRLLLPKMAKATYSDTPFRHFGLALEYYSHFTSPIRRYPDLQVHRIIKEQIRGILTPVRVAHYK